MRSSVQGVDPPVCCTPGCYCYICKRQFLWIHRLGICPLEGGPRHIGTSLTDVWFVMIGQYFKIWNLRVQTIQILRKSPLKLFKLSS